MAAEPDPAGDLLAEVEHRFLLRRADELRRWQRFCYAHRHAVAIRQLQEGAVRLIHGAEEAGRLLALAPTRHIEARVIRFAVVNAAREHGGGSPLPVPVRAEHQRAAVGQRGAHLAQEGEGVAEEAAARIRLEAEAPLVPAVAQHGAHHVHALAQQLRHVIRLHLRPEVIIIAIGREIFIAHARAVGVAFIQPEPAHIGARLHGLFRQGEAAAHQRVDGAAVRGDPAGLPRLSGFARFKPGNAGGLIARFVAHGDAPIIPCARGEGDARAVAEGVEIGAAAAVVQNVGEVPVGCDDDAGRLLARAVGVLRDPGKAQVREIVAERRGQMVGAHGGDDHGEFLLTWQSFS